MKLLIGGVQLLPKAVNKKLLGDGWVCNANSVKETMLSFIQKGADDTDSVLVSLSKMMSILNVMERDGFFNMES